MSEIHEVHARLIADCNGDSAVEAEVVLRSGIVGRASVAGKDVSMQDVRIISEAVSPELEGLDVIDQMELDLAITEAAGTAARSAVLTVSLACARAAAEFLELPLFRYLGGVRSCVLPELLYFLDGQSLFSPKDAESFPEAFRKCLKIAPAYLKTPEDFRNDITLIPDTPETLPGTALDPIDHQTVSGTLAAAEKIHRSGKKVVLRQTGCTGDDGLADLAVALNAGFIAPGREAGICVGNRLLRIGEMLGDLAEYGV